MIILHWQPHKPPRDWSAAEHTPAPAPWPGLSNWTQKR